MTLDNAIKRYRAWSKDDRIESSLRDEHREIAEWLSDYKNLCEKLKTDKWIYHISDDVVATMSCSICGGWVDVSIQEQVGELRFCPYCGEQMRKDFKVRDFNIDTKDIDSNTYIGKWVPISEELPSDDSWKIVTIYDESADNPNVYVDVGWYLDFADGWIMAGGAEVRRDVIAWMKLPKKYEEV